MSRYNDDEAEARRKEAEGRRYAKRGSELMREEDEESWTQAVRCFKLAIELSDDPMANCMLGGAYMDGKGVEKSLERAFELFIHDGDDLDDPNGLYWTAVCFEFGLGVEKSEREADKRLREAARCGLPIAQLEYGKKKIYGSRDETAVEDGIELVCLAAAKGLEDALSLLEKLDRDKGVRYFPDGDDGIVPFTDGQRDRLGYGESRVGMMFRLGLDGVEEDEDRAYHWCSKSVANGCPEGMYQLAYILRDEDSRNFAPQSAAALLFEAANAGYAPAKREAGMCCLEGLGVEKDEKKARELLTEAARRGDMRAKMRLEEYFG